ncbi:DUF5681 domain-containing protein [Methylobacterium trifolii]|uniref:DUF5681 domain-containing protein n=1 Tax=Methylobacterium trifolii TaxID=1003092 RepID=A0ABQ4TUY8_9HYPH|nr:DUF5681 domain-containing protein [Methylobacterium trifolii]GJE59098.1 hypothetical protein MPOCJGCO_1185 [Methylobacterium trifolii]
MAAGTFQKGQSGNPAGRPKGARHKTTLAVEALLEGEAEALTRKAIDLALEGDGPALRLCLDRLCPPRKDRHVAFALPPVETAADAVKASSALVAAVAAGELTPSEAAELGKLVETVIRGIELVDVQDRLTKLEALGR